MFKLKLSYKQEQASLEDKFKGQISRLRAENNAFRNPSFAKKYHEEVLEQRLEDRTLSIKREYDRKVKSLFEQNIEARNRNEMLENRMKYLEARLQSSRGEKLQEDFCQRCQAFSKLEEDLLPKLSKLKSIFE